MITAEESTRIQKIIKDVIKNKLKNYSPETDDKPFHHRLLGRDRMALFSFIHSLNTTFGISIFEPIAASVAKKRFQKVKRGYSIGKEIRADAQKTIDFIVEQQLSAARNAPNKLQEIETIRKASLTGTINEVRTSKVDLYLEDQNGHIYLFDIKTVKPNRDNFKDFKRKLLLWIAIILCNKPDSQVASCLAIPYNPYAPHPYQRWTMTGMIDINEELKVAEEFWDFLYGKPIYLNLLKCFEIVGLEMRAELDQYFSKFELQNAEVKHK